MGRGQEVSKEIDGSVDVALADDERRKEAKDVSLHAVEEDTLGEGGFDDGPSGQSELDALHEAGTPGLHGDVELADELPEALLEVSPGILYLIEDPVVFHDGEELKAESAGERTSAKGAAVPGHAKGVEEIFGDEDGAERETSAEGFAEDDDVGANAAGLGGEPVAGAAEAALDLVEDEHSAVAGREAARGREKGRRALVDAAFPEQGLEEDGAGVLVDGGFELGDVVAVDKGDAREAGAEVGLVLLLAGDGERTKGAAMVGGAKGDDAMLARRVVAGSEAAGELERAFDGLRAAGREEGSRHAGQIAETFGEVAGVGVAVVGGEMDEAGGLVCHGGEHARVGVADGVDAEAGHHVEVTATVEVQEVDAFAAIHDYGIAGVDGKHAVGVAFKNLFRAGAWVNQFHRLQFTVRGGIGQGKVRGRTSVDDGASRIDTRSTIRVEDLGQRSGQPWAQRLLEEGDVIYDFW